MKFDNMAALREMLERKETQQLDDLLLDELRKDDPNGELIRMIGSILQERDRDNRPDINENIRQAWEQYQEKQPPVHRKPKPVTGFLLKVASVLLVLFALLAIMPQEAKAMNFFERFIAWTEDIFSLISPAESGRQAEEYVFRTENPGLQEVYDTVVELGITTPVVPMWIPEGYELAECKVTETPSSNYLFARFFDGNTQLVYQLNIFSDNYTHRFYKDGTEIRVEERNGIDHTIIQNYDMLVAVWTIDNIQCSIGLNCPEETMIRILDAIYTMEEN